MGTNVNPRNLLMINNSFGINNSNRTHNLSGNTSNSSLMPEYNTYLLRKNDYTGCFNNLNNIGNYSTNNSKYRLVKSTKKKLRDSLKKCNKIRDNNINIYISLN